MRPISQITRDDALVHQVRPVKMGTDMAAAIASTALLWRRRPLAGLLIRYLPPMAASALVLAMADLDRLRDTPAGRYVIRHMPSSAVVARMAGDTVVAAAARRRSLPGIAVGAALIAAGWSHGLLGTEPHQSPAARHRPRPGAQNDPYDPV